MNKISFCFFSFKIALIFFLCSCSFFDTKKVEVKIPAHYQELMSFRNVKLYGGSGENPADPIIIKGALNAMQGSEAERRYLEKKYPGFILSSSDTVLLKSDDGKTIDCVVIFISGGKKKKIYFDITEFYEHQ